MAEVDQWPQSRAPWWKTDFALIGAFALLKMAINGAFITRYGFQRDELYFIACGRHPAFGYVDHTPMVPWISRVTQMLFGETLLALRVFPLLAGGLSVILAGLLVREMGGKRWAQAFACAVMIAAPAYLRGHSILHIPTFEMIYWSACFLVLARIVNGGNDRLWLLFGLIAGVGILNKPTMLFFGAGVAAALALTPLRAHLKRPWVYAGGLVAFLIFLPNIVWQYQHDWATYRFVKQLNEETMQDIPFIDFMLGQILYMGPLNAPVWALGLASLLFMRTGAKYRALGIICVTVFAIMVIAKAKVYYLAPAYPALFAGGAHALEQFTARRAWARCAAFAVPLIGFFWTAPLGLPIVPVDTAPALIKKATFGILDDDAAFEVTGDWRDQHGWENQVDVVRRVYESLSLDEQKDCIIMTRNYGQAGAIDFFGKQYGLPDALCTFMTYYYWGPGVRTGTTAIVVGVDRKHVDALYRDVQIADKIVSEHVNRWENNVPVYLCRQPVMTIQEAWKTFEPAGF